jgi:hypothetical protein
MNRTYAKWLKVSRFQEKGDTKNETQDDPTGLWTISVVIAGQ